MNWLIIIIAGVLALSLIIFLVIRNQKDEKQFIEQLDNPAVIGEENPDTADVGDEIH